MRTRGKKSGGKDGRMYKGRRRRKFNLKVGGDLNIRMGRMKIEEERTGVVKVKEK